MSLLRDVVNRVLFNSSRKNVLIGKGNYINRDTIFEGANRVGNNNGIKGVIGYGTYIGSNCKIDATIGKYCSISNDVIVLSTDHPISFVSTSPCFYSTKKQNGMTYISSNSYNEEKKIDGKYSVTIGNDVLISYGAYIMGGIKIGDGAVIGANSVVTHDVQPYSVVGGNPAKLIKMRFPEETVKKMMKISWWNWEEEKIRTKAEMFSNVSEFIKSEE